MQNLFKNNNMGIFKWLFGERHPLEGKVVRVYATTNDDNDYRVCIDKIVNGKTVKFYALWEHEHATGCGNYTNNINYAKIFGKGSAQQTVSAKLRFFNYDPETEKEYFAKSLIPDKDIFKQQVEQLVQFSIDNDIESYNKLLLEVLNEK